jgi:hypothetical protein
MIESISLNPSAEPFENAIPLAKFIGQFTPLRSGANNPEHRLHKQPGITPSLPRIGRFSKTVWLNDAPLGIGQNASDQGCSPLFATLNQNSRDLGILNVNSP